MIFMLLSTFLMGTTHFLPVILEKSRRITSKANLWADLGSREQMAAAVQQAAACGLRGTREVAVHPEWRDTSALCAVARRREPREVAERGREVIEVIGGGSRGGGG